MASPVYSRVLASVVVLGTTSTWISIGSPPSGFRWVVRHAAVYNNHDAPFGARGILLGDEAFVPFWGVTGPNVAGSVLYEGTLHQTIMEGGQLTAFSNEPGWSIRVSGFELTLP